MPSVIRDLERCCNIFDLRELARRRMPAPIFRYLDGGAETEVTLHRNVSALDSKLLVPCCLVDTTKVNTATQVLGVNLDWPVICAPTGASRLYHPDGELAVARAARQSGTLYSLSVAATHSAEEVSAASDGPKLMQILPFKDGGLTRELIARCRAAGFQALCVTLDASVRGNREQRELPSGVVGAPPLSIGVLLRFGLSPRWLLGQALKGAWAMPNIAPSGERSDFTAHTRRLGSQLNAAATWKDIKEIARAWGGPLALKGLMSVEDARRAIDVGATAAFISNHGGRQLDGAAAPIDVLPEIAAAVGDKLELILDGGIRRGTHVLKALALGAHACSVGRAYLYGLGAAGEAGAYKALHILKTELVRAMQLAGCTDVRNISPRLVLRSEVAA